MIPKARAIAFSMTALCLLVVLTAIGTAAQTKQPNLSGTWKMNTEKSKFEQGGPDGIIIKFDHKDSSLTESLNLTGGGGERTIETKYTTDGKETTQEVFGTSGQTSAKWEGDTLSIEWKIEGGSFTRKIKLSADGKTITMFVRQARPDGQSSEDTVVLEKQEAK